MLKLRRRTREITGVDSDTLFNGIIINMLLMIYKRLVYRLLNSFTLDYSKKGQRWGAMSES